MNQSTINILYAGDAAKEQNRKREEARNESIKNYIKNLKQNKK